jgi:sortase A
VIATPVAIVHAAPVARPATGAVLGRLLIPRLGVDVVFRQGTSALVVDRGPGHYPSTSLPGHGGTVGIAGHRVTHTHPFLRINLLRRNDQIVIVAKHQRYEYRVFRMRIVPQRQAWPLRPVNGEQLVLTACHPPRTDLRRLIVFARLSSVRPVN